jgi:5-formyltetrahydrofolate cyclo-ligase
MQTSAEIQKTESQIALSKQESQAKLMQEQIRMEAELDLERDKMLMEAELEKFKASLKAETDLKIANMQAEMQAQEMRYQMLNDERNSMIDQSRHAEKIAAMNKPKKVVFDKNGRVQGIE